MNLTAITALIRNDIRLYRSDRRAVVVGVLVPILIAAFFGYIFGGTGSGKDQGKIAIAIVDEDQSSVSRAITADLTADKLLQVSALDRDAARGQVKGGRQAAAAIFPQRFGEHSTRSLFTSGNKPQVELLVDPSQTTAARVIEGLLAQYSMQEISKEAFGGSYGLSIPYTVASTPVTAIDNAPYNSYAHSFAGMAVQFILFAGIDAGVLLLLTRQRGIWQRLRSAPLGRGEFILARALATTLIGLFQISLIYLAAMLFFQVRVQGSWPGLILIGIAFCLLNATFGLMLATLGRSASSTRGLATMATLLLVMLGGAWVPTFVFPRWLQEASRYLPTRWAVDGLDGATWRGLPFEAALQPTLVLTVSATICLLIAIWRFRWEE